jgi:hypothetical protein
MTVLYAVRGTSGYFKKNTTGTGKLVGGYTWDLQERNDSWLELLLPESAYAEIIDDLMMVPPKE